MFSQFFRKSRGFTLIEILIVIGIIAILAAIVIVAINPAKQFAQARNTQREAGINALLNAIGQNMADNKGVFTCSGGDPLPSVGTTATTSKADLNIRPCLVPVYISELPQDPSAPANTCTDQACSSGSYDTEFNVTVNSTGRVSVCAPNGAEPAVPGSTVICVTR